MALVSALKSLPNELVLYIRDYVDLNRFNKHELLNRFTDKPTEWLEYENGLVLLPSIPKGYTDSQKAWIRTEFPLYQAIAYICDDSQGNIDPVIKNCEYARHQTIKMIQNESQDELVLYDDYEDKALFNRNQRLYLDSL